MIIKSLLILIFILSSTSSFSFLQEFEFEKTENDKKNVKLSLIVGTICYRGPQEDLVMYSYFGGNRVKEFYNSCAVVEHNMHCLGKVVSSRYMHSVFNGTYCVKPVKYRAVGGKTLYKSFTDKFECKKQFDELVMKFRENKVKCTLVKKGELLDQFVDFENENKKGIANEK
ncbi:MAG: hypothetical protein QF441_00990 [Bacteriovoracaceae bacterium]|jgi:hypothetical protein|nr:hypothetical protein [Halobacteriovoraceae bacterium]MDP7319145.1 hypothetical protein [Bacteriovoracaceae bacterium]|tara:strand:- start:843 stop:1355 length:513 start_codon:yes stop_codon:yes gene_type:complete